MDILLFILIFGAACGLLGYNMWRRAKQIHALMERGTMTQGVLVAKRRPTAKGKRRYVLSYEYSPDGTTRKGISIVSREQFERHTEGQLLPLRYLTDQPAVSAPEFVIQQMSERRRGSRDGT